MCISNDISDNKKKQYIQFLISQTEQKAKQVEDSTKLYFQSIFILGASIAILFTALAKEERWADSLSKIFIFGVPLFLIAWFGCFLLIYWEHHMIRISLDFSEKKLAESLGIPPEETYLYHEDFLGIFNQTNLSLPLLPKIKAVQVVFVFIGLLVGSAYFYFIIFETKRYFENHLYLYALYLCVMSLIAITLLVIHCKCVRKERRLKAKLNIVSKVDNL